MDSLFGGEVTGAARFVIAFVVVLLLIGVLAWLVRRFSGRGSGAGVRGRQPRLAVIDAATVDARRRLILVRRDNVEHLLMIGGPTDVVIEPNIVRAAVTRETARATPIPDMLPHPVPLGEGAPLAPPPEAARPRAAAPAPVAALPPAEASLERPPSETLADLAAVVASQVPPPAGPGATHAPPAPPLAAPPHEVPAADPKFAEMAQRLEAALRRLPEPRVDLPGDAHRHGAAPPVEPPTLMARADSFEGEIPEVHPEPPVAPRPDQNKNFYASLEQEMASLLGRPTGKT
jgi:hypothetical protein